LRLQNQKLKKRLVKYQTQSTRYHPLESLLDDVEKEVTFQDIEHRVQKNVNGILDDIVTNTYAFIHKLDDI
jgi:hypothetical protein